jgi:glycosyltransferase involved in cell wall biosynthesis
VDDVTADPDKVFGAFDTRERIALFEFPHPSFFESLAAAHATGWVTVYDVMDDWEEFHRVGQAVWYEEAVERHFAASADAVFAVNALLMERVRGLGAGAPEVLGNGLRPAIATVDRARPLERGEVTIGYFGYLAGAWFDWEKVSAAARARPSWRFYLIGYGGQPEGVELPKNVRLLGKKPFTELAGWAANWDVATVPFKEDRLAAGADPIKTYEYLALGLPVVVTGVFPPPGAEGYVKRASSADEFVTAIAEAAALGSSQAEARRAFALENTWSGRVDALLAAIRRGDQGITLKRRLAGAP